MFNLNRNVVTKRLTLHTHPIIGIEWSSINCLITWSFTGGGSNLSTMDLNSLSNSLQSPSTSSMGSSKQQGIQLVKNEILFTDIRTGKHIDHWSASRWMVSERVGFGFKASRGSFDKTWARSRPSLASRSLIWGNTWSSCSKNSLLKFGICELFRL